MSKHETYFWRMAVSSSVLGLYSMLDYRLLDAFDTIYKTMFVDGGPMRPFTTACFFVFLFSYNLWAAYKVLTISEKKDAT